MDAGTAGGSGVAAGGIARSLGRAGGDRRAGAVLRRALVLGGCAVALAGCVSVPVGIQGRWLGQVTPVSGVCDPASQAVLTVQAGGKPPYAVGFSPTGGVLTLQGRSDGGSEIAADLHTVGIDHKPYTLAFRGTRDGDSIAGTYVSSRCRSSVLLHRG